MKCHLCLTCPLFILIATSLGVVRAETLTIEDAQLRLVDDVIVSCRDAGLVRRIVVKPNDNVEPNALLIELDNEVQFNQVQSAEKQLAIANAESSNDVNVRYAKKSAEVATKELERAQAAVAQYTRAVSKSELDKIRLELEQSLLAGEQAAHELHVSRLTTELRASEHELAKIKLDQRSIMSPLAGEVADVLVDVGEWVNLGTPVARVLNLDRLRIVALVPERYLLTVANGQRAELQLTLGDKPISAVGAVSFVSPEVNPVNREFVIWVDIENLDHQLRPGLVGRLSLEIADMVQGE